MASNNYGVAFVVPASDMEEWLKNWDWEKPHRILAIKDDATVPDLREMENAPLVPGDEALEFVLACDLTCAEQVYWGNGFHGLCLYGSQELHYILAEVEPECSDTFEAMHAKKRGRFSQAMPRLDSGIAIEHDRLLRAAEKEAAEFMEKLTEKYGEQIVAEIAWETEL